MRVIKVRHIKREIKEEDKSLYYHSSTRHTKTYQSDVTQVLCMNWYKKLVVKEFNGKWDLKDLKVGR